MKKIFTCSIAYLLLYFTAYAQLDESKNFLYLYSDSVLYANNIYLERDLTGMPYFRIDGRRVHPEQVKFFNNEDGFYANSSGLSLTGETIFYERIRKGKINVYEERFINWDNYEPSSYGYQRKPEVAFTKNFYNQGTSTLKKATYANLSMDMAGRPESLDLLARYRSIKNAEKSFYIAAGSSLAAGLISFIALGVKSASRNTSGNHSSPNFAPSYLLMGAGIGFSITGFTKTRKAPQYLKAAMDTYNR